MSGVVFDEVSKRFGEVSAVDSLTLEIVHQEWQWNGSREESRW